MQPGAHDPALVEKTAGRVKLVAGVLAVIVFLQSATLFFSMRKFTKMCLDFVVKLLTQEIKTHEDKHGEDLEKLEQFEGMMQQIDGVLFIVMLFFCLYAVIPSVCGFFGAQFKNDACLCCFCFSGFCCGGLRFFSFLTAAACIPFLTQAVGDFTLIVDNCDPLANCYVAEDNYTKPEILDCLREMDRKISNPDYGSDTTHLSACSKNGLSVGVDVYDWTVFIPFTCSAPSFYSPTAPSSLLSSGDSSSTWPRLLALYGEGGQFMSDGSEIITKTAIVPTRREVVAPMSFSLDEKQCRVTKSDWMKMHIVHEFFKPSLSMFQTLVTLFKFSTVLHCLLGCFYCIGGCLSNKLRSQVVVYQAPLGQPAVQMNQVYAQPNRPS